MGTVGVSPACSSLQLHIKQVLVERNENEAHMYTDSQTFPKRCQRNRLMIHVIGVPSLQGEGKAFFRYTKSCDQMKLVL